MKRIIELGTLDDMLAHSRVKKHWV